VTDYLLDTHALLWWVSNDQRLAVTARKIISTATRVVASDVSLWEMAVKCSIGKLQLQPTSGDWFERHTAASRFGALAITRRHMGDVEKLPLHHRDPFDRMLIAQARAENLTIITVDAAFNDYDVTTIW
jgi:PIN domain nuclease of toxin-antitoxin system